MRFALTGGGYWLAWSNGDLKGTDRLVARLHRADERGRRVDGRLVDLSTPHGAYVAMVGVIREYGPYHGPLDVAAEDDDGMPITWVPEPDAASKVAPG
jgi:hypothetical protein